MDDKGKELFKTYRLEVTEEIHCENSKGYPDRRGLLTLCIAEGTINKIFSSIHSIMAEDTKPKEFDLNLEDLKE